MLWVRLVKQIIPDYHKLTYKQSIYFFVTKSTEKYLTPIDLINRICDILRIRTTTAPQKL